MSGVGSGEVLENAGVWTGDGLEVGGSRKAGMYQAGSGEGGPAVAEKTDESFFICWRGRPHDVSMLPFLGVICFRHHCVHCWA